MKRLMWLSWPLLCLPLLLGTAAGAEDPPPGGAPAAASPAESPAASPATSPAAEQEAADDEPIDPDSLVMLKRMADALGQAKRFSVTIRASYDVVQDTGEKVEFGERRTITLDRPDALRVDAQLSDGTRTQVTFDGKAITVLNPADNVYGQIEAAGSVDDAIRHLVQGLHVRLPLALLLVSTLSTDLEERLQSLDYVERDTLTAVPTDHLAGQTEEVDFQVWIAAGDPPLPQRVTITYKDEEGQPQYRADFTDWNLDPDVSAPRLAFHPPEGAERIPFMIRTPRTAAGQPPPAGEPPHDRPGASGNSEGSSK